MDWKILLDLVVSGLLVATIAYAVRLNNRLNSLRKNRDDIAKIIVSFNEATVRAESSIPKLKRAAEEAGGSLQERVEKAQSLRDDLAFMIERADTMANRLESSVRAARSEAKPGPAPAASRPSWFVPPRRRPRPRLHPRLRPRLLRCRPATPMPMTTSGPRPSASFCAPFRPCAEE